MDISTIYLLAGLFVHSDQGFGLPKEDVVLRARKMTFGSARAATETFCGQFMETEQHEEMFGARADEWEEYLLTHSEDFLRSTHPDIFELYDRSV